MEQLMWPHALSVRAYLHCVWPGAKMSKAGIPCNYWLNGVYWLLSAVRVKAGVKSDWSRVYFRVTYAKMCSRYPVNVEGREYIAVLRMALVIIQGECRNELKHNLFKQQNCKIYSVTIECGVYIFLWLICNSCEKCLIELKCYLVMNNL